MSEYIECPYCGEEQEIDNDGYSYDVGTIHRQECTGCGKNFAYKKTISIYYEAFAAPCINGDAKHDWKETKTIPRCYRKLRCSVCGEEEEIEGVEEERKAHLAELRKRTGARA
jgi:transposase-like protein